MRYEWCRAFYKLRVSPQVRLSVYRRVHPPGPIQSGRVAELELSEEINEVLDRDYVQFPFPSNPHQTQTERLSPFEGGWGDDRVQHDVKSLEINIL